MPESLVHALGPNGGLIFVRATRECMSILIRTKLDLRRESYGHPSGAAYFILPTWAILPTSMSEEMGREKITRQRALCHKSKYLSHLKSIDTFYLMEICCTDP